MPPIVYVVPTPGMVIKPRRVRTSCPAICLSRGPGAPGARNVAVVTFLAYGCNRITMRSGGGRGRGCLLWAFGRGLGGKGWVADPPFAAPFRPCMCLRRPELTHPPSLDTVAATFFFFPFPFSTRHSLVDPSGLVALPPADSHSHPRGGGGYSPGGLGDSPQRALQSGDDVADGGRAIECGSPERVFWLPSAFPFLTCSSPVRLSRLAFSPSLFLTSASSPLPSTRVPPAPSATPAPK